MVNPVAASKDEALEQQKEDPDEQQRERNFTHRAAMEFLREWHSALNTTGAEKADGNHWADRGDRAGLRRCRSIDEVLLSSVYFEVRHQLQRRDINIWSDRRLASVVGLLARVKVNDESDSFARQLARRRKESNDAKLSGLRFRRLLQIDDRDTLYEKMIGVIRLLDGSINVPSFARDIFYWNPDTSCDVRKKWAEQYYSQLPEED